MTPLKRVENYTHVPLSTVDSILIFPPWFSTVSLQVESPIPEEPAPLTPRINTRASISGEIPSLLYQMKENYGFGQMGLKKSLWLV